MKKYFINNKEVKKEEWSEAFKANPQGTVILRLPTLPEPYNVNFNNTPISPERAKEIRNMKYGIS